MKDFLRNLLGLSILLASVPAPANISASANFTLRAAVLNNGAGEQASANFRLNGSLGEAAIGSAGSTGFTLNAGFFATTLGGVPSIPSLLAVFSRKVHGAAGTFDIPIDIAQAIGGAVTVEPRAIGSGHTIVFSFDAPVTVAGAASATGADAMPLGSASVMPDGNNVLVTLTAIPDNRRLLLSLTGVNGNINAQAAMGFLVGDVNNSRSVNATDIAGIKARSGQATNASSMRFDLNASGGINASDIAAVKARSGLVLP